MTYLHPAVVEGARFLVRQAAESTAASLVPSSTSAPDATSVIGTVTSIAPTSSETIANGSGNNGSGGSGNGNGGGGGGGNGNNSPLLFFVALGFGVVFTNLWIIVGVKYCFRYNARSRQMRMGEDGEPINMENMPRPHRRRREKKLMTIDEVNEKFPMLKYKTWVASRMQEGLPTRGGVTAPPSRANSVRDAEGVTKELPSKERMSTEDRPTTSTTATVPPTTAAATTTTTTTSTATPTTPATTPDKSETPDKAKAEPENNESTSSAAAAVTDANATPTEEKRQSEAATIQKQTTRASHDEDEEEDDDHINAALPPECLGTSGDTCAICIDTLEDDDDVRGLTCGHAFHAVCLDPWLTSRRACCPLCKADYYTPKPRPPAPEGGEGPTVVAVAVPDPRMNMPGRPRHTFFSFGRGGGLGPSQTVINSRRVTAPYIRPHRNARQAAPSGASTANSATAAAPSSPTAGGASSSGGLLSRLRGTFPTILGGQSAQGSRNQPQTSAASPAPVASGAVTPSQLEAGVARA